MLDSLIVSLAALCAHFCETDSFLALRIVNKHWLHYVFSQDFVFKHFTLNDHWQSRSAILVNRQTRWHQESCIFRHLSSFKHTLVERKDTQLLLDSFFRLSKLSLVCPWTAPPMIKHQLPQTITKLSVDMVIPTVIPHFQWNRHIQTLESLTLQFASAKEFGDKSVFLLLYDELPQLLRLNSLTIHFKTSATLNLTNYKRHADQLETLLRALPHLKSFVWNVTCLVRTIKALQAAAGESCQLELGGVNTVEWFNEMKDYLESEVQAAAKLRIAIVFGDCIDFKRAIDACYLIRKSAVNFAHRPFPVDQFLAPAEWSRFGKCAKLKKIDLYWTDPFLLRLEHLQELLPVCKQLRIFKIHNVVTSTPTFEILKEWIYKHMTHLEHIEPLQNVTFVSKDVERSLRDKM